MTELDEWKRRHGLAVEAPPSGGLDTRTEAERVYAGSNGEVTKAFYAKLQKIGTAGLLALNLFRAQKCSERAKTYRHHSHREEAYGRKQWSMDNLCNVLAGMGEAIRWGWREDPKQPFHKWVLYVEIPTGQVSFHAATRGVGPDYPGDWDGSGLSVARILEYTNTVQTQNL